MIPVALTIAGSDPSGGAGIQADLKTFHQFRVYGEAVITLLTVQNTCVVSSVSVVDPGLVRDQIRTVLCDIPPKAAKTGALGNAEIVAAVAAEAEAFAFPLVVDPVMISKHGTPLMSVEAQSAMRELLVPHAALVTPNLPEASSLCGFPVTTIAAMRRAAETILALGCGAVLVKGGHLEGDRSVDVLLCEGKFEEFEGRRWETPHTHGTGCTYSAAITALLAGGKSLSEAVAEAKAFMDRAIRTNPGLGGGSGPVNHFA